jgi:hypothetical protein
VRTAAGESGSGDGPIRLSTLLRAPAVVAALLPGGLVDRRGRIVDLVVDLGRTPVEVVRAVSVDEAEPVLATSELLLGRDVLDAPGYDVEDERLVRVGEVWLERTPDGRVRVAGLEVGPRSTWSRVLPRRWRGRHPASGSRLVDLADVHLATLQGHAAHLATPGSAVHRLDDRVVADLVTVLPARLAIEVLQHLAPGRAAIVTDLLHPHIAGRLRRAADESRPVGRRRARRTSGWRRNRPPGHDRGRTP